MSRPLSQRDMPVLAMLGGYTDAEREHLSRTLYASQVDTQRDRGLEHVDRELDRLCAAIGVDPWEARHRPRHHERLTANQEAHAHARRSAEAVLGVGKPKRDHRGRFLKAVK